MSIDQFLLSGDTTDLNYPEIRPSLDLNFARTKTLDPRITFTRGSGGSYVGADGLIKYAGVNEARFDHDPETGESLGLLIEEARTNIFQRSEEFDDSYWSNNGVNINQDSIQAPDGSFTADAIIEENNSLDKRIARNISMTVGNRHTLSVYAKIIPNSNQRYLMLVFNAGFGVAAGANFDLVTGKVGVTRFSSASMIPLANGWYRCVMTPNDNATGGGSMRFRIASVDTVGAIGNPGENTYQGDGVSGFYLWGAQLEEGAFPTSYIPTQASTRTRAADNASITGKNFSSFYRQDEGTVFLSHKALPSLSNRTGNSILFNISSSSSNGFFYNTFSDTTNVFVFGGEHGNLIRFQQASLTRNKVVFSYNAPNADYSPYVDGNKITTVTTINPYKPSSYNRLVLGPSGAVRFSGHISRLTYFPKRLPNSQLQALTR